MYGWQGKHFGVMSPQICVLTYGSSRYGDPWGFLGTAQPMKFVTCRKNANGQVIFLFNKWHNSF